MAVTSRPKKKTTNKDVVEYSYEEYVEHFTPPEAKSDSLVRSPSDDADSLGEKIAKELLKS